MAGLDAALLRLSLPAPVTGAHLAALHGPLMLAGFLGTVISLERAVAARRRWAWVAPYAHAVGMLALLAGAPSAVGKGLLLVGALGLDAVYLYILRTRAGAVATQIEALGALSLTLGTWLWLMDKPLETVATLWLEFLIFTIIGERLELGRSPASPSAHNGLPRCSSAHCARQWPSAFCRLRHAQWLLLVGY